MVKSKLSLLPCIYAKISIKFSEMAQDYSTVTELASDDVTSEQVERISHRYHWAAKKCIGKDVLEVACGAGQGLGLLAASSKSVIASDITKQLADEAAERFKDRVKVTCEDAMKLPYSDGSFDVIILFEALYYLPSFKDFLIQCKRLLRSDGMVLIASANPDLYDFNPSPMSVSYYGVKELKSIFELIGFKVESFGYLSTNSISVRQKLLRPVKYVASKLKMMPGSMSGKKLLKRLVFGKLVKMPKEIQENFSKFTEPEKIPADAKDTSHKVIYVVASFL